jgi:hypothetical protein
MDYVSSTEVNDFVNEVDQSDDISLDNNYEPEDMEILLGDADNITPSNFNVNNIWKGTLFLDGGGANDTSSWTADGRSGTLIELMQANFIDFFQEPQQVLSVKIYTKSIDACTILQEINNTTTYNKYFMIKRATWEQQEGYWEVEAYQLIFDSASLEDYLISEGDVGEEEIISEGDVGEDNLIRE